MYICVLPRELCFLTEGVCTRVCYTYKMVYMCVCVSSMI